MPFASRCLPAFAVSSSHSQSCRQALLRAATRSKSAPSAIAAATSPATTPSLALGSLPSSHGRDWHLLPEPAPSFPPKRSTQLGRVAQLSSDKYSRRIAVRKPQRLLRAWDPLGRSRILRADAELHARGPSSPLSGQTQGRMGDVIADGSTDAPRVAVVGAGVAGLVAAARLAGAGCHVEVFDLGRGPGGRMSQRRESAVLEKGTSAAVAADNSVSAESQPSMESGQGSSDGVHQQETAVELRFDHGAQYFSIKDGRVRQFLDRFIQEGIISEWQGRFGTWDSAAGRFIPEDSPKEKFVCVPGMNALCHALSSHPRVSTTYSTHVAALHWQPDSKTWQARSAAGDVLGSFDAAVIAAAYRTFAVRLEAQANSSGSSSSSGGGGVDASDSSPDLEDFNKSLAEIPASPCFALMLAFPQPLSDIPFDGALISESPFIAWMARDSSKPGRKFPGRSPETSLGGNVEEVEQTQSEKQIFPGVECWVVHSTADYAKAVMAKAPPGRPSPELLASVANEMLTGVRDLFGPTSQVAVVEPIFSRVHRWGGAFPSEVRATKGMKFVVGVKQLPVVACGDFCTSPRVEGAMTSAIEGSEWLAGRLGLEMSRL